MFYNCTSLNYIKCLATDISASNCTSYWVFNVSLDGTFVKSAEMNSWDIGASNIPDGWTVQNQATAGTVDITIGEGNFTNTNVPFDVDLIWHFRWNSEDAPIFETGQGHFAISQGSTNFWGSNDSWPYKDFISAGIFDYLRRNNCVKKDTFIFICITYLMSDVFARDRKTISN